MAVIETWLTQDLQEPVQVQHLCGSFFSHNGNANRIGVKVFDNGSAASLSGTVSGYAVIEDGTTVPCTGSLSGNQASVLLPAAAYVPGNVCVTIMLTSGTTVTTLAALVATVVEARTDTQVDPGSVVTDWTNTINAALQTVENYTGNIIATPYASLTYPVPLGKYCIYNNLLYRCVTPISSSESWTSSHWVQTKLSDDVSDLKSALHYDMASIRTTENLLDGVTFKNGGYYKSNGDIQTDNISIYSEEYIPVTGGKQYYFNFPAGDGRTINICSYNSSKDFISRNNNNAPPASITLGSTVAYVRFSLYNGMGKASEMVFSGSRLVDGYAKSTLKDAVNLNNAQLQQVSDLVEQDILPTVYHDIDDKVNKIAYETNIFNSNQIKTGGYYKADGSLQTDANSIYIDDYISTSETKTFYYYFGGQATDTIGIIKYPSDKSTATRENLPSQSGVFSVGNDDAYIRFFVYNGVSNKDTLQISPLPLISNKSAMMLDNGVMLNSNQISQVSNEDLVLYSYDSSTKTLTLTCDKTQYIIKRQINNNIELDSWRLFQGYIKVNDAYQLMWNGTDAEGPILIEEDEAHFISGFHGYEKYDDATIYIDNTILDISTSVSGSCKSVMLYQSSTVYEFGTTDEAFKRYKRVRIIGNDFNVQQQWVASIPCTVYRGAFCLMQCPKDLMISNNCWDTDLLLPMGAKSNVGTVNLDKATRIGNFYLPDNTTLSLVAEVGCDNEYFTPYITDYGANGRFKFYFDMYNGKTLSVGDKLFSKFSFKVNELQ